MAHLKIMMTSSNGNVFRVTGPLYSPVPVNSPHKGQWRGALMFPLICAWINDWVNNREAGDLRRYSSHYDVSVMLILFEIMFCLLLALHLAFLHPYGKY